jgi:hypothetical protein
LPRGRARTSVETASGSEAATESAADNP